MKCFSRGKPMLTPSIWLSPSIILLQVLAASGQHQSAPDFLDLIDPLVGTAGPGHVFPGASLPYGMAKSVADTDGDNKGGFNSWASVITGFSHMHDSGTGGGTSLGNFPVFPYVGCPEDDINQCKFDYKERAMGWKNESVKASPGYFSVRLDNDILAEMTVSNHTALYRFTFPNTLSPDVSFNPLISIELNDLARTGTGGAVTVDAETGRISGNGTFRPSFGVGNFNLHFCADFHGAKLRDTGVRPKEAPKFAYTRFGPESRELLVRVGLSFMNVQQACKNAETELEDFVFDDTVSAAREAWKAKLSVIEIETGGVSKDIQMSFWSGIYRTMISPQDYTGENPLWESDEPYFDSFYCIWDSFRILHPFLTVVDPAGQSRMVRTLVDVYRHTGYLPDCRMSLCKGQTQGGSNADVVLVESYLKGISGIDWDTAYEALIKDAEIQAPNWLLEGRGSLESWKNLGYVAKDDCAGEGLCTRSISRNVEYAYNDFCIGVMAKERGNIEDSEKYTNRSRNWLNLFREDQKSYINGTDTGFTGVMQPRLLDGSWDYQDPILCSPLLEPDSCYLNENGHETYETSCWLYTFFAPHDMKKLIQTLGGVKEFNARLEYLHESGLLYIGNEPAFLTIYLFHYTGRPGLSSARAHSYIPSVFNNSVAGLPGNDDSGAMGAFVAFNMIGLYPVHGQNVYLIIPPFFKEARIRNPLTGSVATIRNVNFDPSHEAIYIESVERDGKPWTKNWIGHDFFTEGGLLELTLAKEETDWGTADEDLPPSLPIDLK